MNMHDQRAAAKAVAPQLNLAQEMLRTFDFRGADILSVEQFRRGDIEKIFQVAKDMEPYAAGQAVTRVLDGAVLGNLFFEPSTRSRVSFGTAFNRLGGRVESTVGFTFSSMAKGESIHDTARVIGGYVDILVVRHPDEGSVAKFAAATDKPVINGGDGPGEHPTQALLDLYTLMKERGADDLSHVDGLSIAMVGDLKNGRTVHSLTKLLTLFNNVSFTFVSPEQLCMPQHIRSLLKERGYQFRETEDLESGIRNADAVYMTRIQEERFGSPDEFMQYRGRYSLTRSLYEKCCRPDTVIMHPLPRDSRPGALELSDDLNDHPRMAIFRQTDNGISIRMALYALVLDVVDRVHESRTEPLWLRRKG